MTSLRCLVMRSFSPGESFSLVAITIVTVEIILSQSTHFSTTGDLGFIFSQIVIYLKKK